MGECRSWIWSTLTAQLRMMSLWWGRDTLGRGQRAQVSPLKQGPGKQRGWDEGLLPQHLPCIITSFHNNP